MKTELCPRTRLDDAAHLYDKATAYLSEHINYPLWEPGIYPSRASAAAAINVGTLYICTDKDTPVGVFVLNADPQGDYSVGEWTRELTEGEYLIIHAFATDPDEYGHGVGTAMVKYAVDLARNKGFKAVRLDVVPDNTPARHLFERCGFTFAGEKDLARGIAEIPRFALYELNL